MLFDQPASLDPNEIHGWYLLCAKALDRERERACQLTMAGRPSTEFWQLGTSLTEIDLYIENSKNELALSTLLLLTGSAEARIRLDGQRRAAQDIDQLATDLKLLWQKAQKPWQVPLYQNGIMDAWKSFLNTKFEPGNQRDQLAGSIGSFKTLLDIRHWLAHGRYWQLKPSLANFSPALAVKCLQDLYTALDVISSSGRITPFR